MNENLTFPKMYPSILIGIGDQDCELGFLFKQFDPENISECDIDLVMNQTRCTRQESIDSLIKNNGDLVMAIMDNS